MKNIIGLLAAVCIMASCNNDAEKQAQIQAQRTVDSLKTEMAKQHIVDSMNAVAAQQAQEQQAEQEAIAAQQRSAPRKGTTHNTYNTTNYGSNGTPTAAAPTPAEAKKKKGWSAKAKGAVIGTGVGAITGAMVNKKKGEGAVVGGLIGAAAGLGAGAIIDKKQKDKEAAETGK